MTLADDDLERLAIAADPARRQPYGAGPDGLDERARADLATILAQPTGAAARAPHAPYSGIRSWTGRFTGAPAARPAVRFPTGFQGHHARRRWLLGAVAATVLAGVAVVLPSAMHGTGLGSGSQAYAATPPLLSYRPIAGVKDPAALLRQIADRAAALPDDAGRGRYVHMRTSSWSLWTRIGPGDEPVSSRVVPEEIESWTAPDGSGLERRTTDGELEVTRPGPGERGFMWAPDSLSADLATLGRQLEQGHPTSNGPAERIAAIGDLAKSQPVTPTVRAALLRYLASTPGLMLLGEVSDRAGRDGVAVALDSDYSGLMSRYTVIVDRANGKILALEETLTTDAGKLNVRVPSVISYDLVLAADRTDTLPTAS